MEFNLKSLDLCLQGLYSESIEHKLQQEKKRTDIFNFGIFGKPTTFPESIETHGEYSDFEYSETNDNWRLARRKDYPTAHDDTGWF